MSQGTMLMCLVLIVVIAVAFAVSIPETQDDPFASCPERAEVAQFMIDNYLADAKGKIGLAQSQDGLDIEVTSEAITITDGNALVVRLVC